MTKVVFFEDGDGRLCGFEAAGHAGYADAGEDIVCAGISTLVINTINSIEVLTDTEILADAEQESGTIHVNFSSGCDKQAKLLVDAMILGLQGIQNFYGNEYISLIFKEV